MQKEFVEYSLALRLKALGFDEPCFGLYDDIDKVFSQIHSMASVHGEEYSRLKITKAPLYQQTFKWFREEYELGHMINGIGHESFIMNIAGVLHIFNAFEFNTYEEAELACLEKLLEIVEFKKE